MARPTLEGWEYLIEMQKVIEGGATPNRAAIQVAGKYYRNMPNRSRARDGSPSFTAAVQWLKRQQRKHRDRLKFELRQRKRAFDKTFRFVSTDIDLRDRRSNELGAVRPYRVDLGVEPKT